MRASVIQHELLTEDVEQIRRFFPGATLIEPFDTPFDIHTSQHGHSGRTARTAAEPVHSAGASEKLECTARTAAEKAAGGVRAAYELPRYKHPKRSELLLRDSCASHMWGLLI